MRNVVKILFETSVGITTKWPEIIGTRIGEGVYDN